MSEKERNIAESLTRACELLPDGKKEYLIGYAEGVAAMAEKAKEHTNGEKKPPLTGRRRREYNDRVQACNNQSPQQVGGII